MTNRWSLCVLVAAAMVAAPLMEAQRSCQVSPIISEPLSNVLAGQDDELFPSAPGPMRINVLANDRGPEGVPLRVTAVQNPTQNGKGSVSITPDGLAVQYSPFTLGGQTGDSFTYTVTAGTATATARVNLRPPSLTFAYQCEVTGCEFWPRAASGILVDSYTWNWGDGSPPSAQPAHQPTIAHFFPSCSPTAPACLTASYNVQLTLHHGTSTATVVQPVQLTNAQVWWRPRVTNGLMYELDILSATIDNLGGDARFTTYVDWGDGSPTFMIGAADSPVVPLGNGLSAANYETPGLYTAQLSIHRKSLSTGAITIFNRAAVVDARNAVPEARFTHFHPAGQPANRFRFNGQASVDEDPWTLHGTWDLGGHLVPYEPLVPYVEHTLYGRQVVRLTVTDEFGLTDTDEQTIDFPNSPPSIVRVTSDCSGLTCTFEALDPYDDSGAVSNFHWVFGDGTERDSSTPTMTHVYGEYGPYRVSVTPDDGLVDGTERRARVTPNPVSEGPNRFFAQWPCLILDSGKAIIASGTAWPVDLVTSPCAIPATAKAVALNLIVTKATGGGYVQVGGDPDSFGDAALLPFGASTLPRATAVIAPVRNGELYLQASVGAREPGETGSLSVRVEATGYFASDEKPHGSSDGPLLFEPITPARRMYDSRDGGGQIAAGIPANVTFYDPVTSQPLEASAVIGNVTAILPGGRGSLLMYPAAISRPSSLLSTMTVRGAVNQAAGFVTSLSRPATAGVLYSPETAGAATHVAVDASGHFSSSGRLTYYPLRPCRAVDTRDEDQAVLGGTFPGWRAFPLKGNCGVPADAEGVFGVITVVGPPGEGWGKVGLSPQLDTSTIHYPAGEPAISNGGYFSDGPGSRNLHVWLATQGEVVLDVYGYFAPPPPSPDSTIRNK